MNIFGIALLILGSIVGLGTLYLVVRDWLHPYPGDGV